MRKRFLAMLVAIALTVAGGVVATKAVASPGEEYTGTHFGLGNIPPGCEGDTFYGPDGKTPRLDNACYHMRTGMNGLDSSDVDVLLMVPASPTATRDMRIMKQAVEMWNGGIHYLAPQMGIPWMKNMHFKISTDIEGAAAGGGFVTYPVVDPKIVIVATNPVGGAGIGIDPWVNEAKTVNTDANILAGQQPLPADKPCTGVGNPFDVDTWKGMPGYDHHNHEPGATVTQRCPNGGGNICFALTPAIDPLPPTTDVFSLFDLVAHEFGHCLTIGHVGDGAEAQTEGGPWSKVATNDIMSYNQDPPGLNKCVSTLDVESIAVTQSHYIDTNGDGKVNAADHVDANEKEWDRPAASGGEHFQVQNPRDEQYASSTGNVMDCPQPDLGILPGTPTNWQPNPVSTSSNDMTLRTPSDGDKANNGVFNVTGTVAHTSKTTPTNTSAFYDDPDNDASSPYTEIKDFTTSANPVNVETTISLASLPPAGTSAPSPTSYSVIINGRKFDSFVRYPVIDASPPMTFDDAGGVYLAAGTSSWDTTKNTVTFKIPRAYLNSLHLPAPYHVSTEASFGFASTGVVDDKAPNSGKTVGIAGSDGVALKSVTLAPRAAADTVHFQNPGGNHFNTEQSNLEAKPVLQAAGQDNDHHFTLDVPQRSDVAFTLNWTDGTGASDLDMKITGTGTSAVDSGTSAASSNQPETYTVKNFAGKLAIDVSPYLIADAVNGVDYTLTAVVTPTGDTTPTTPPPPPAPKANEHVRVFVDGATTALASQDVDTSKAPADFNIPVDLPAGHHTLRVEWERFGKVVASQSVTVHAGGKPS